MFFILPSFVVHQGDSGHPGQSACFFRRILLVIGCRLPNQFCGINIFDIYASCWCICFWVTGDRTFGRFRCRTNNEYNYLNGLTEWLHVRKQYVMSRLFQQYTRWLIALRRLPNLCLNCRWNRLVITAMFSFLFDALFWGVLSWYLNRVARSEYGRPLPWYFPFTRSYWCPGTVNSPPEDYSDIEYPAEVPVEPVSTALKEQLAQGKGIEIRKLTKTFGEKTAVDQLSMNIFSNQITALLGHNGAGKTTTISMLTGMLDPTSGYAKVGGKDIRTEMDNIRGGIGICLQHDCLFPELTVREHISFFARVKGLYAKLPRSEAELKVDSSIRDVALSEKSNTLSKNLSGGMKRKLSVAIAFCGDRLVRTVHGRRNYLIEFQ
jgi:ABC-type ATPase involved in cell division